MQGKIVPTDPRQLTKNNNEKDASMTHDELTLTSAVILIAGSETSATVLSGIMYNLADNPEVQKKAQVEIRSAFQSDQDMTLLSLSRLKYLSAVIEESLRCYPAVPGTFPRRTGPDGNIIAGHFVPKDVSRQYKPIHDKFFFPDFQPDLRRCTSMVDLLKFQKLSHAPTLRA